MIELSETLSHELMRSLSSSIEKNSSHTLILFGDDHLQMFEFLLAKLSCLTLIAAQSVRFCDVSEGNVQNIKKEGQKGHFGEFFSP